MIDDLHPTLLRLTSQSISASDLRSILREGGHADRRAVANLWLSEGVPFTFSCCPALYEHMRAELGERLQVSPTCISMTGSRRIGYSMDPAAWGAPPRDDSDFDLFVVNERLFRDYVADFESWARDVAEGAISSEDRKWWRGNLEAGRYDIARGFLADIRIPELARYKVRVRIGVGLRQTTRALRRLAQSLGVDSAIGTAEFPFGLRVYKTWPSAVSAITRSLQAAAGAIRRTAQKGPAVDHRG